MLNITEHIVTGLMSMALALQGLIGGFYLLFKGIDTDPNAEKELSPLFLKLLVVFQVPIFLIGIAYCQINIAKNFGINVLVIIIMAAIMVFLLLGFFNEWRWALYVALGGLAILIALFVYSAYGHMGKVEPTQPQKIARLYGLHGLLSMLGVLCLSISAVGAFGYFKSSLSRITNALLAGLIGLAQLLICSRLSYCIEKSVLMIVAIASAIAGLFYLILILMNNTNTLWEQTVRIVGAIAIILNIFVIGHFLAKIDLKVVLGTIFDAKIAKLLMLGIVFTFFACVLSIFPVKEWQKELYYALSGLTGLPLLIVPGVFGTENWWILILSFVAAGLVVSGLCLLYQDAEWQNWLGLGLGLGGFLGIGGIVLLAHTLDANQSQHIIDIIDKLHTGKFVWDMFLVVFTVIIIAFSWLYLVGILSKTGIFSTNVINTWLTISTIAGVFQIGVYLLSGTPLKLYGAKWWILCGLFIVMMVLSVLCLLDVWLEWFQNVGECVSVLTTFVNIVQMGCLLIVYLGDSPNSQVYPGLFLKGGVALVSILPALIGVGYLLIRFCKSDIGIVDPEAWKVCAIMQLIMYGVGGLYYGGNEFSKYSFFMILILVASIILVGLGLFWGQKNYLLYAGAAVLEILILTAIINSKITNIYLISAMMVPIFFIATIGLVGYFDANKLDVRLYLCFSVPVVIALLAAVSDLLDKKDNHNGASLWLFFLFIFAVSAIGFWCTYNNKVQTIEFGILCSVTLLINILISGGMFIFDSTLTSKPLLVPQTVQFIVVLLGCLTFMILLFLSVARNWSIEFYYAFAVIIGLCIMVVPSVLTNDPGFLYFIVTFVGAGALTMGLILIRQNNTGVQAGGAASGFVGVVILIACLCCIGHGKVGGDNAGARQVQSVISSLFLPKGTKVCCGSLESVNTILKVLAVFFKVFTWLWFVGLTSNLFGSTTTKAIHIVGDIFGLLVVSIYFWTDLFFKYQLPFSWCKCKWFLWGLYFTLWLIAFILTVLGIVDLYTKWTLPLDGASWLSFAAVPVQFLCFLTIICINNPQFKIMTKREGATAQVIPAGPVLLGAQRGKSAKLPA